MEGENLMERRNRIAYHLKKLQLLKEECLIEFEKTNSQITELRKCIFGEGGIPYNGNLSLKEKAQLDDMLMQLLLIQKFIM